MTKENIKLFSEMHAEPSWLADLRQKAFDKIETLELPVLSVSNSTVGIWGMERLQKVSHQQMFQISLH